MLSVGVVSAGGVGYYVDTVASGIDDYYVRTDPGRWFGAGADHVGLTGPVAPGAVETLAAGAHPVTGVPLGAAGMKVVAYDLTFSAPKSVSVLAEIAADPAIRAAVVAAHHQAITETIGLLEVEAVRGRRGHAGAHTIATTGMIAAGFDHHTSRAGDPQLHTHLLVANRALGADGQWGAVDGRRLYGWAKTAGYAYETSLRHHLTDSLGITWQTAVNGIADIHGISTPALAEFSTRRAQIVAALHTTGATSPRAAQIATLATRPPKPAALDPQVQRLAWQQRARTVGLDPDHLTPTRLTPDRLIPTLPGVARADNPDPTALADVLSAPSGLTLRRSSFDRRAVLQAVAVATTSGMSVPDLVRTAQTVVRDGRFVRTGAAGHLAGPTWTTVELAETEARLVAGVDRRRQRGIAVADPGTVTAALVGRRLSVEQADMVRTVTTSGHGVEVVVGPAGTGKSTALDAARAAWTAAGVDVIGAALAARTARALEAGTAIPSATVDQLLADLARPGLAAHGVLPTGGVLVVDEAGMVGTRTLARLLDAAERSRTKVLLVGDPRQLPEIDAGGAFAHLAGRHPAVSLTINRRQAHAWERDALSQLRHGQPAVAVAAYTDHGRITFTPTADEARDRLVTDWAAGRENTTEPTVMIAMTRTDVDDLNTRALHRLEQHGRLDPARDRLDIGDRADRGRTFGIGEQVMALRNDRRAGIVNGTTGIVTGIDHTNGSLTIHPDQPDGNELTVTADYLADGHLTHGWAITAHKAQGITVSQAYVLGTDHLYREAGYVALSRATDRTDWYQPSPTPSLWATSPPDRDDDLIRLLTRTGAQHLATTPLTPPTTTAVDVERAGRLAAILADPGQHLTDTLGPPPLTSTARHHWAATALTVDDYRHRHRITGPDPLGPTPTASPGDSQRYRDWVLASTAIDQTLRQLGRDLDLDRGLSL